ETRDRGASRDRADLARRRRVDGARRRPARPGSGARAAARRPDRPGRRRLDRRQLREARLGEALDDRLAARALVVPGERHLPHQVRIRTLDALVALERVSEPHHAALATDAADLDRLRLRRHYLSVT